jgi:hypothetical protein
MIETIVGAAILGGVSAAIGKAMAESNTDGCNGHHWGDPYRPDSEGISRVQRAEAGLDKETVERPKNHYSAEVRNNVVVLRGKTIRKCQDCDEYKVGETIIGNVNIDAFE